LVGYIAKVSGTETIRKIGEIGSDTDTADNAYLAGGTLHVIAAQDARKE
jgi:hypothetical protein